MTQEKETITREYKLERGLAVAITNADPSGLEADDLELYNTDPDLNNPSFVVTDWNTRFERCDFCRLGADCVTIQIEE